DAAEDVVEHGALRIVGLEDAHSKLVVEFFETLTHAAEFGRHVFGLAQNLIEAFACAPRLENLDIGSVADAGDARLDLGTLTFELFEAAADIRVALRREAAQLIADAHQS